MMMCRRRRYERNARVAETARHVAPHWPKLHKAEKRCRKAYMRAFKAHLALAAAQPTPQGGDGMDLEPPGFGWSMPAFNSIPVGRRRRPA